MFIGGGKKIIDGSTNFVGSMCQLDLDFLFDKLKNFVMYILGIVRKELNYLIGFDKIKKYISINKKMLLEIQNFLFVLKLYVPMLKSNYFLFILCLIIYIVIWAITIPSIVTILLNPSFLVNILLCQNILLLICSFFYGGSEFFFEKILNLENLNIFIIILSVIIITIILPKKYIISLFLIIILFILNMFTLFNLILFDTEGENTEKIEEL